MSELGDTRAVPQWGGVRFSKATPPADLSPRSVTNIGEIIAPKSPNPRHGVPHPRDHASRARSGPMASAPGTGGGPGGDGTSVAPSMRPWITGFRRENGRMGALVWARRSSSFFALSHDQIIRPIEARAVTAEGPCRTGGNPNRLAQRLYRPARFLPGWPFGPACFLAGWLSGWPPLWPVGFFGRLDFWSVRFSPGWLFDRFAIWPPGL